MRIFYLLLISSIFLNSCSAQKELVHTEVYNSFIENNSYVLKMLKSEFEDAHNITLLRKVDSLFIEMKITPSLDKIFNNVSKPHKNKYVFMSIIKLDTGDYIIEQLNFVHLDGRNTSLHLYSSEIFDINLLDFKIHIIDCVNCTDRISLKLYEHLE